MESASRQILRRFGRSAGARTRSAASDCIVRTVSFGPDPLRPSEATIIKYSATRMDLRFDGEIAAGPYQIVLRRMNAGGKSYALARLKVDVV